MIKIHEFDLKFLLGEKTHHKGGGCMNDFYGDRRDITVFIGKTELKGTMKKDEDNDYWTICNQLQYHIVLEIGMMRAW